MGVLKRIIQILSAVAALLLLFPLLVTAMFLIFFTTGKWVLYRGKRVGKDGRIFNMYKLRTLKIGSEGKIRARLLSEDDPYIIPVGGVLRRLKIDEIPQLFNVIKGEMNFIGPRPIRPIFYDYFLETIPRYQEKFKVKPGLTGLAQVMGDYQTPVIEKLKYEIFYNSHKNIRLDVKIIFLTLKLLFKNLFKKEQKL